MGCTKGTPWVGETRLRRGQETNEFCTAFVCIRHDRLTARTSKSQDVADELDIHEVTLLKYCRRKKDPCPHSRGPRRSYVLDTAEVLVWMKQHNLTGTRGHPSAETKDKDLASARLRKENALASKYELHVAQARGELMDANDVEQCWAEVGQHIRNGFTDLPVEVVPMALRHGMPQAAAPLLQAEIQSAVDRILTIMSKVQYGGPTDNGAGGAEALGSGVGQVRAESSAA
jgi:phage terminase Nu1 subunit (DNA packaging protein)